MKTNQVMTRKMGDFEVYQRTKDAMFNASSLLQQWNMNRKSRKSVDEFLRNKSVVEFMDELGKDVRQNTTTEPVLVATVKSKNNSTRIIEKTDKQQVGRPTETVWMHPYLFIKFAMWLNPRFEVQVIKFVYDQLITLRNQIGDGYKEFSNACAKIGCVTPDDYKIMARCLNCAVLGKERQSKQRNELTEKEADDIDKISNLFVNAVENGWITTIDQAKAYFRKEYNSRFLKSLPF